MESVFLLFQFYEITKPAKNPFCSSYPKCKCIASKPPNSKLLSNACNNFEVILYYWYPMVHSFPLIWQSHLWLELFFFESLVWKDIHNIHSCLIFISFSQKTEKTLVNKSHPDCRSEWVCITRGTPCYFGFTMYDRVTIMFYFQQPTLNNINTH